MKKRVVTGLFLGLVLVPAIYFGGIFYTIIALALVGVGTYEIMNMFNRKSNRLNKMKYVIPIFSVIVSAMLFRAENIVSEKKAHIGYYLMDEGYNELIKNLNVNSPSTIHHRRAVVKIPLRRRDIS